MLDSEPTDTPAGAQADSPAENAVENSAAAPAARAPRKRAPRKATAAAGPPDAPPSADGGAVPAAAPAPRKRAPRKAVAPAVAAPAAPSAPAPADAGLDAPAPAKKAARRAAKKTAAAPATDALLDLETPVADAAAPVAAESDAPPAPAKRAPRKRAAKKAAPAADVLADLPADGSEDELAAVAAALGAPPADSAVSETATTETAAAETATGEAGAPVAPSVLFLPPSDATATTATTGRRRSRKATAAAGPPASEPTGTAGSAASAAEATSDASAEPDGETELEGPDPDEIREAAIEQASGARRRRRRGRRGRGGRTAGTGEAGSDTDDTDDTEDTDDTGAAGATGSSGDGTTDESADDTADDTADDSADETADDETSTGSRRRRRRRRSGSSDGGGSDDPPNTVTHVRESKERREDDGVKGVRGSTRLEAKRQRRRDGRETTRRRAPILTEAEFLARREAVERVMAVRQHGDRTQIAVLEDDVLVEHYVTRASATSYVGNVYLGRVQNVLPSMEAAFIDIGKGRNGVLYAGEVNWDAAGLEGKSRTIESALKSGDTVLVQVTKDPIGHKGARLTSQISLPGRFLVYVPSGGMTGISRRLPDTERHRLKAILKKIVPEDAGVIVRTAAEGASEEDLTRDVERLQAQWQAIEKAAAKTKSAPTLVHGEPDLAIRVVRDVFNEDFASLVVQGDDVWQTISGYVESVAPDLATRTRRHTADTDLFHDLRVDEQLMKALDRKVWLPSGGSLVIDRTEAMTVIDVNTGKFVGSGGNLEQTVTRNNLEAAEEVVRQLRLRDVGGIVVIDFIDMVLESNRDLVLRRLTECLGRDRTKHQVAEVTSLGLVQMTRKRVGEGLLEAFSEPCEVCHGRGVIVHGEPVDHGSSAPQEDAEPKGRRRRGKKAAEPEPELSPSATVEQRQAAASAIAAIHRAASGTEQDEPTIVDELASGLVEAAAAATDPTAAAVEAVIASEAPTEQPGGQPAPPVSGSLEQSANGHGEPQPATPAPRRRRRAASRPAGPPVTGD